MSKIETKTSIDFAKRAIVLVTGASKGIGRAIAIEISRNLNQNSILILLARSEQGLADTKNAILELDKTLNVITHSLDLTNATVESYEQVLDQVTSLDTTGIEFGVIFHNVGSTGVTVRTTDLIDAKKWHDYFSLNLISVAILNSLFIKKIRPIAPQLAVINITSLCGRSPFENLAMYGCGKAARDLFFKVLAIEEPNVIVLNYSPGPVDTEMFDGIVEGAQSTEVRDNFRKVKETGAILRAEVTVSKMIAILEEGTFKSGDTIDYFD